VKLRLDTQFLSQVEEEPTFDLDTREKMDAWSTFKKQSYKFYSLIAEQDNKFWLTHKVDKRGRIYASGYHITTQGSAFKKASIELAHEEVVTGVPC
jgi:DNA-directed RNA polymerase